MLPSVTILLDVGHGSFLSSQKKGGSTITQGVVSSVRVLSSVHHSCRVVLQRSLGDESVCVLCCMRFLGPLNGAACGVRLVGVFRHHVLRWPRLMVLVCKALPRILRGRTNMPAKKFKNAWNDSTQRSGYGHCMLRDSVHALTVERTRLKSSSSSSNKYWFSHINTCRNAMYLDSPMIAALQ